MRQHFQPPRARHAHGWQADRARDQGADLSAVLLLYLPAGWLFVCKQNRHSERLCVGVQNDLGVGESDEGALLANLAAQGISDVQSVEFNSGKKLQASAPVPAPAPAPTATVNTESAGKASNGMC